MAFPSTTGTTKKNLSEAWNLAREYSNTVKLQTQNLKNTTEAGNVNAEVILTYATTLADLKLSLDDVASLPGLAQYAQEQINDSNIVISTEYNNMISALDQVVSWIVANFPKDGDGYLLINKFTVESNGRTTSRTFSPAETAGLRTVLDALLATIN